MPDRHAQGRAQIRDQAGNAQTDPPLPHHLLAEIELGTPQSFAMWTFALDDAVLRDLHRRRWRYLNNLTCVIDALTGQRIVAHRAALQCMTLDAGRHFTMTRRVVLWRPLLALTIWRVSLGAV